jgi:RNA polymerase sigma factor (sigma-70 family)
VVTPRLAFRQQPDAAFEKLYRQHVGDVYRYTLAVLGNPADAEDVTQTTFMNAYRAFHSGERPRKAGAWLRTIAHNVCRQRWRQAARRPLEVAEFDEAVGAGDAASGGLPEEDEGPSAADITRALQSLPFNQRAALVMRELEGRRQAEIARELDLSESAVEALLFRARRAMREQLESSITCGEAARAISRQLDRSLSREEQAGLRAHLRECEECATFARQSRAQRGAFKALGAVPVPIGLLSWSAAGSGGAGAAAGGSGAGLAATGGSGGGAAASAAGAGGSGAGGLAAVAGGGSGAAAAAAGGAGTAGAFGLKVAAGIVAVAVVAGGGERVIRGAESESGKPSAGESAQKATHPAPSTAAKALPAGDRPTATELARERNADKPGKHTRGRAGLGGGRHAGRHAHGGTKHTPVRAHGTPTHSNGTPAASNGNATRAHGNPAHPNGTSTGVHGSPTQSHGTPTRAHGSPTRSNGSKPPKAPPEQSNGTQTRAHGTPTEKPPKP